MKRILYIFVSVFVFFNINAQTTGGPDLYGYTWKSNAHTVSPPAYSWFDISVIGTAVTGLADDNFVGPFSCTGFQYYWYPVTQFWIGSNGFISFSPQNIASPFPATVPLSSGANDWIAPLMGDLNFTGTGNTASCYYYANADTVCVSFINVPFWANTASQYTGSNTFQVILNKVDKSITFNYLSTNLGVGTLDNVVGIENNSGTLGLSSLIDVMPTTATTRKFYYPTTVTYAVTDGGMNWNGNDNNAGYFIQALYDTVSLSANVKNFGNQYLGSFSVKDTILNSSGTALTTGTLTIPHLGAGIDTLVHFTNNFTAPSAGIYRFNTAVSGITGDMVMSNNYLQQEVIAVNPALPVMTLDYSDGLPDGSGIGWNGGDGGIAVYIEPPVYPAIIASSRFYISANATVPVGFHAMIYDDDGINGGHGTLLDSVYVAPTSITTGVYTTVLTSTSNITIDSGGVYVLWLMDGPDINLARDLTLPISRQTYEVVGGGWSGYRDLQTEDFLIGLNITQPLVVADFYADLTSSPSVQFSDSSTNTPTSWLWDFGVAGATSTVQNPSYTYAMNGNYHVCLTATKASGSDSVCKTIAINNAPIAGFSYDATNSPLISFTDTSSSPDSWLWDFGVAGATSTLQNPTYTYAMNGSYNVCLIVSNSVGTDSVCKTIIINNPPIAVFSFDASNSPTVSFTDASSDVDSWLWDFGDGGTASTMQNPSYTYTANGNYLVCLTASNTFGSDTACQTISITGVGISTAANHDIITRIYPNPNKGEFVLEIYDQGSRSLEIDLFSPLGAKIYSDVIQSSGLTSKQLNLQTLTTGIYYLTINSSEGRVYKGKVIIE